MIFEFIHKDLKGGDDISVGFNTDLVLTAVMTKKNGLRVSLRDWHEEVMEIPQFTNSKKTKEPRKERRTINTEIYITDEKDIKRFIENNYIDGSPSLAALESQELLGEETREVALEMAE